MYTYTDIQTLEILGLLLSTLDSVGRMVDRNGSICSHLALPSSSFLVFSRVLVVPSRTTFSATTRFPWADDPITPPPFLPFR